MCTKGRRSSRTSRSMTWMLPMQSLRVVRTSCRSWVRCSSRRRLRSLTSCGERSTRYSCQHFESDMLPLLPVSLRPVLAPDRLADKGNCVQSLRFSHFHASGCRADACTEGKCICVKSIHLCEPLLASASCLVRGCNARIGQSLQNLCVGCSSSLTAIS